jgi:N-acetylglucosaminyldiphosphoundecaprenol N-acetyl-beta-D-mannosaminyltransferase
MARVYGPDLMRHVCELSAGTGARHFMYGGAPGVPEELGRRLAEAFPGLDVVGAHSPPFRALSQTETSNIARLINASNADIVWVGLSTPKQERWIESVREQLHVKVMLSVGAAFDFHTGRVRQAPGWMQSRGLEWLYRLAQEPRRLWRRYAYNNPIFLGLAFLQITGLKQFPFDE